MDPLITASDPLWPSDQATPNHALPLGSLAPRRTVQGGRWACSSSMCWRRPLELSLSLFLEEGDVPQMVDPASLTRLPEIYLINPWLLGEECKPIIIRDADKTLHLLFPRKLIDLR